MGDGMMTEIAIIGGLLILASGINLFEAQRDFHHESASRPLYSAHLVWSAFSNGKSLGDTMMLNRPHMPGAH